MTTRRDLVGGGLLVGAAMASGAALAEPDPSEVISLWPDEPPGGVPKGLVEVLTDRASPGQPADRIVTGIARPTLTVFRPSRPDGSSVVIAPGGGYIRVVRDNEGFEEARWLAARGVTAFVLLYRLPADGWEAGRDAPLQDAQRALRLARADALARGRDPARVGVLGFSAGGHVAGSLAVRFDAPAYPGRDPTDALSARPDFAGLIYPVVSMRADLAHKGSRLQLLGRSPGDEAVRTYSVETCVRADSPPTFLVHAFDDTSVPAENSLALLAALRVAKIPVEFHGFQEGGHGFGLRKAKDLPAGAWPELFHAWGRRGGWFRA